MKKFSIMVGIGFALTFCLAGAGLSQTSVEKVLASPDVPIRFENPAGAPLVIQSAYSKVITSAEYKQLTRDHGTSAFSQYATFPTVTLINNTDQRVTSFALLLRNKQQPERRNFVKLSKISIEPYSDYILAASEWVLPDKQVQVTASGEVIKMVAGGETRQPTPDLGSQKMWLPADASDLVVKVAMVEFKDGSVWDMERQGSR